MCIKCLKKRWCNYLKTKWKWCMLIPIFILLLLFISVYILISSDLNNFSIIFLFLTIVGILIVVCHLVQNKKLRTSLSETTNLLSENSLGITITTLIILVFLLLGILYIFSPPQIFVEPQKIEAIIPAGDSIIRAISIENIGSSDKNVSINLTESIENWVNIAQKDFIINSAQIKNVNFSINIPLQTPFGDYRGAIKIIYKNNTITEIPILLTVQPQAQFQATINVPERVNRTDYFKVKINIKNIGESPVYGIKIKINKNNTTGLNLSEVEEETIIGLLPKNVEFSTEWWIKANETGWQTLHIGINSSNAGNQTIITKIVFTQVF